MGHRRVGRNGGDRGLGEGARWGLTQERGK